MKVGKALMIGYLWVIIPTVIVFLACVSGVVILFLNSDLSVKFLPVIPVFAIAPSIFAYSYLIVKWKVWVLTRGCDISQLDSKGRKHLLFYSQNSVFSDSEIKNRKESDILSKYYSQLLVKE
ncbi:MAG: hypothetical protein MI739_13130 [Bacteroidales bacterium]|nr:hypothetical protein [Bacteroidales bacterium]